LPCAFLFCSLLPDRFLRRSSTRNLIGHFHHGPHRFDVVNPHDVRAVEDGSRNRRRGRELGFEGGFSC
jgi:hypothetical protein